MCRRHQLLGATRLPRVREVDDRGAPPQHPLGPKHWALENSDRRLPIRHREEPPSS